MAYNPNAKTKNIPENIKNKDVPKYYKWTYVADNGKIVGSNISQETAYSYLLNQNNKFAQETSAKALEQEKSVVDYNNAWSAKQAELNRNWQEEMSNTAHQREVKDLVAAGLNPILSANGGAAVGSGAVGTTDTGMTGLKTQLDLQKMSLQNQRDMAELSAGTQLAANEAQIQSAQTMARWSNALQRELGYANLKNQKDIANIGAAASAYAAQQAASASMYGAQQAAAASMYGANKSYEASRYSVDNPNSMWGFINQFFSGKSNSSKTALSWWDKLKKWFK